MTIDEILRRIVKGHLRTILTCILLPVAIVAVSYLRTPTTYVAQVRLQTTSTAPASSTEADGLSSRLLAIATTPNIVQSALKQAGEPASARHAIDIAAHHVTAERLGESSIVVLSVLDTNQDVATRTVGALASKVSQFMNQGDRQQYDTTMAGIETRLAAALKERDRLQRDLDHTFDLVARQNVTTQLAGAQQALNQVQDERSSLVVAATSRDNVVAIDATKPTVQPVASDLVPRLALAFLLGLLVGLALAVVLETLRPRMAGIRVLARSLDAPILGSTGQSTDSLAGSLTLAARRQGVETVVLLGVDDRDDKATRGLLEALPHAWQAEEVREAVRQTTGSAVGGGAGPSLSSQVRFTDRMGVTHAEEPTAGVVVVSAGSARRSSLDAVEDMVRAMRWPVVGVVEVTPRHTWLGSE